MGQRKHKPPDMPHWFWYAVLDGCWCCKNRNNCHQCKVDIQDKITITTSELQAMLSCGRYSAVQIGDLAKARIQIGKRIFWNVEKVKSYINKVSG